MSSDFRDALSRSQSFLSGYYARKQKQKPHDGSGSLNRSLVKEERVGPSGGGGRAAGVDAVEAFQAKDRGRSTAGHDRSGRDSSDELQEHEQGQEQGRNEEEQVGQEQPVLASSLDRDLQQRVSALESRVSNLRSVLERLSSSADSGASAAALASQHSDLLTLLHRVPRAVLLCVVGLRGKWGTRGEERREDKRAREQAILKLTPSQQECVIAWNAASAASGGGPFVWGSRSYSYLLRVSHILDFLDSFSSCTRLEFSARRNPFLVVGGLDGMSRSGGGEKGKGGGDVWEEEDEDEDEEKEDEEKEEKEEEEKEEEEKEEEEKEEKEEEENEENEDDKGVVANISGKRSKANPTTTITQFAQSHTTLHHIIPSYCKGRTHYGQLLLARVRHATAALLAEEAKYGRDPEAQSFEQTTLRQLPSPLLKKMERFRAIGKIGASSHTGRSTGTSNSSSSPVVVSSMESRAAARRAQTSAQLAEVERVLDRERHDGDKKDRSRRRKMEHTLKFNKQRVSAL